MYTVHPSYHHAPNPPRAEPLLILTRSRTALRHSAAPIQVSIHSPKQLTENLHESPAHKANTNHKRPARDSAKTVDSVADRDIKSVLREPAIRRVQNAIVGRLTFVGLLVVDLEHDFWSYGCRVQVGGVKGCWGAPFKLSLRNLEVPDGGSAS